jgi:hypothetical protein
MSNLNQNLNDNLSLEPQFQREKLFTIDKDTGERKFFAYAIYCFLLVQQSCFKNFKVFYSWSIYLYLPKQELQNQQCCCVTLLIMPRRIACLWLVQDTEQMLIGTRYLIYGPILNYMNNGALNLKDHSLNPL